MKTRLLKISAILLSVFVMSFLSASNFSAVSTPKNNKIDETKVLQSRFLNMLNHNSVYDNSFDNLEDIVNDAIISLLEFRDQQNYSYIKQSIVNNYLYDMFGFKVDDFSQLNSDFPFVADYVYILPRGFSKYNHTAVDMKFNEDNTITFITDVQILSHDGISESVKCKTVFVENQASVFGYNIVRSDFLN